MAKVVGKVVLRNGKVATHGGCALLRRSLSGLTVRVMTSPNIRRETVMAHALRLAVAR
jgi:hypothetical protein